MFRFIQYLMHSLCDFFVGKLDVSMSQWVINIISILAHQTGALTKGSMLHDIQQQARSTPVKPLAIKALSFDSWGAYLLLSWAVNL